MRLRAGLEVDVRAMEGYVCAKKDGGTQSAIRLGRAHSDALGVVAAGPSRVRIIGGRGREGLFCASMLLQPLTQLGKSFLRNCCRALPGINNPKPITQARRAFRSAVGVVLAALWLSPTRSRFRRIPASLSPKLPSAEVQQ